jgi:hypothetical protein
MADHLKEMQKYIQLSETKVHLSEDALFESIDEDLNSDVAEPLFEELSDIAFKLRSYTELSENQDYARGKEEGLSLAADMINRFIDRFSSR